MVDTDRSFDRHPALAEGSARWSVAATNEREREREEVRETRKEEEKEEGNLDHPTSHAAAAAAATHPNRGRFADERLVWLSELFFSFNARAWVTAAVSSSRRPPPTLPFG